MTATALPGSGTAGGSSMACAAHDSAGQQVQHTDCHAQRQEHQLHGAAGAVGIET